MINKMLFIFLASLILTSCTSILWRKSGYEEEFQRFLMSEDGAELVVIGKKFHYIFSIDENLQSVLLWGNRKKIHPHFYDFSVSGDGIISGNYRLDIIADGSNGDDIGWLLAAGFQKSPEFHDEFGNYFYDGVLNGIRYRANRLVNAHVENIGKFSRKYQIFIGEADSSIWQAGKILMTPVTVALDGGLVIGAGELLLFYYFIYGIDENCKDSSLVIICPPAGFLE
jgi:hypothetical protein